MERSKTQPLQQGVQIQSHNITGPSCAGVQPQITLSLHELLDEVVVAILAMVVAVVHVVVVAVTTRVHRRRYHRMLERSQKMESQPQPSTSRSAQTPTQTHEASHQLEDTNRDSHIYEVIPFDTMNPPDEHSPLYETEGLYEEIQGHRASGGIKFADYETVKYEKIDSPNSSQSMCEIYANICNTSTHAEPQLPETPIDSETEGDTVKYDDVAAPETSNTPESPTGPETEGDAVKYDEIIDPETSNTPETPTGPETEGDAVKYDEIIDPETSNTPETYTDPEKDDAGYEIPLVVKGSQV
ncbi:uncharacterized protein LOC135095573 [Scylla paramamosain]|uniref:uncharacterized protein LOC135095573 n=1 Tax=Scylla paramamosain TaxID=85552 RepID=UPI0030838379